MGENTQERAITLTQDQMSVLVNPAYTGSDDKPKNFLPIINILQSDKQYDAFGDDANNITMGMYGKLFVRKDRNCLTDLVDTITVTQIRRESGHEIYEDQDGKEVLVASNPGMMPKDKKEQYIAQTGRKVVNMLKIVVSLVDTPEEAMEMVEYNRELAEGTISGDKKYPFAVLTISKSRWESWRDAQKQMSAKAMASAVYGNQRAENLAVTCFKFEIAAKKIKGESGRTFYIPEFKVSLNNPDTATGFFKFTTQFAQEKLFNKAFVERVAQDRTKKFGAPSSQGMTMKQATQVIDSLEEEVVDEDSLS